MTGSGSPLTHRAVVAAPAYNLGQAKALTLTSLTPNGSVSSAVKMTKQVWNAMKDSHTRVTVTVTNTGGAVDGPFYLEILTVPQGASVFNSAGMRSTTGNKYLVISATSLAAGAAVTVEVELLTPIAMGKKSAALVAIRFNMRGLR